MSNAKMRDGLVKRGETWSYVIRVPDALTGKTKPKWVGGFPTKLAAKEARDAARHSVHRGVYAEPAKVTLGQYLEQWLDSNSTIRESTLYSYRQVIRLYVQPHPIAQVRVQALKPSMLTEHWARVRRTGSRSGGQVSVRTVSYAHSVVRAAINDADVQLLPAAFLWNKVKVPRDSGGEDKGPAAWSPEDLRKFLEHTSEHRLHTLWLLMANTGMRRGEALALRWDDVDLETGDVRIARAVSDVGDGPVYDAPKNGEARTVHAPASVRDALKSWKASQAEERLRAGSAWVGAGLVFTMENGRAVTPNHASKTFLRGVRESKAPALTLHGLRHTAATLLLRDGASVHLVAKMLGHKDPSLTLRVYSHAIPGDDRVLADQLERIIGSGIGAN